MLTVSHALKFSHIFQQISYLQKSVGMSGCFYKIRVVFFEVYHFSLFLAMIKRECKSTNENREF